MTQQRFCPRCGKPGPLHELHRGGGVYRRFRKTCDNAPLYCESCIDRIKRQEAVDRKDAAMRQYNREQKHGRFRRGYPDR